MQAQGILQGRESLALVWSGLTNLKNSRLATAAIWAIAVGADTFINSGNTFSFHMQQVLAIKSDAFLKKLSKSSPQQHGLLFYLYVTLVYTLSGTEGTKPTWAASLPTDWRITVSMNQLIPDNSVLKILPEHLTAKRELSKYWQEEGLKGMHHHRWPSIDNIDTVLTSTYIYN